MKQQQNSQLDLFSTINDDRLTSFPVDEEPELVEVAQPPASGNSKIKFDAADLERQLREICDGNKIKVKINTHQDVAVNIYHSDKGDTAFVNPKRWRGEKKTKRLEQFIFEKVANGHY